MKAQTHYLTLRVEIAFKNKTVLHRMHIDIGHDGHHPLANKLTNIESGAIKIAAGDKELTFNNEVDLLNYLENNGWDLVSVNEVAIIEKKHLQYLFKSE